MKPRVALGNIFTESNHLAGVNTTLADFERTELRRGPEVFDIRDGVVGGALGALEARGVETVPLLVASAYPGGILTEPCYLALKDEFIERLKAALPVGGVLAPLHGAAGVERIGDLEGDLLQAVRKVVGTDVPVVATLDCHAHVTRQMVENSDALLAWETYPHRDTFTTGERGANLLADIVDGKVRPVMAMAKAPVLVSGFKGNTDPPGAFAEIMTFAKSLESRGGVLSTSALLVHPHLDLPDMGGGGLVITDGDPETAASLANEIASMLWERRSDLETTGCKPGDAIERGGGQRAVRSCCSSFPTASAAGRRATACSRSRRFSMRGSTRVRWRWWSIPRRRRCVIRRARVQRSRCGWVTKSIRAGDRRWKCPAWSRS